jgi:acetylornithine deacetylase
MNFPSLKMGPGASSRSHTADEFVYLSEIREAIALYIRILDNLIL